MKAITSGAIPNTDELNELREFITKHEDVYPGISFWFKKRVEKELGFSRKSVIIKVENRIIGASILKIEPRRRVKICHLSINPEYQNMGFGSFVMAETLKRASIWGDAAHFTLPDFLWDEECDYFTRFGFKCISNLGKIYRKDSEEFRCTNDNLSIWRAL
jgi:N-acetylglutamate synthase-like GNAT family acetyltransferase